MQSIRKREQTVIIRIKSKNISNLNETTLLSEIFFNFG